MKRILITILCCFAIFGMVKSQMLYQDKYVKIKGFLNEKVDSCIFFQIENVSDSILILNEKSINYVQVRKNEWSADLSLLTSGVSLLQPSFGHFMSFKRLSPREKYTAVAYSFPLPSNQDSFKLFIQIDYMPIPFNLLLVDNLLYQNFIDLIKNEKLKVHSYMEELRIIESESDGSCWNYLLSSGVKRQ